MSLLKNNTKQTILAQDVRQAKTFLSRAKGLLGKIQLEPNEVMWIHRCNSIHTWFMKFPIDVVFVDKHLIVKSLYENLKPWRITFPNFKAKSVFEFSTGVIQNGQIEVGDELYVGD